jgi:hypothetical protein
MQASTKKAMLIFLGIAFVIILIAAGYVYYLVSQIKPYVPQIVLTNPKMSLSLLGQNLLFYNYTKSIIPYFLVGFNYKNVTNIYLNGTIFLVPVKRQTYLLNATGDCFNCGNVQLLMGSIEQDLAEYGVINSSNRINMIKTYNITSVRPNSTLILVNGFMPLELFQNVSGRNETVLQYLLNEGTAIIYVGDNFSYVLKQGPIGYAEVPNPDEPSFLYTIPTSYRLSNNTGFYFKKPTFVFYTKFNSNGMPYIYGPTTYLTEANGSILVFPNFINTWNSYQNASSDIAKAASELFWLPKISSGTLAVKIKNDTGGSGAVSLFLNVPMPNYTSGIQKEVNSGYGRITAYTNNGYLLEGNKSAYSYLYYTPHVILNGTFGLPQTIIPGRATNMTAFIFGTAGVTQNIGTSIYLYDRNLTLMGEPIPGPFVPTTGNFSFLRPITFELWQGNYIATLKSFYGTPYASALVFVKNLSVQMPIVNVHNNTYEFYITSSKIPLNNINYTLTLNSKYPSSGTIYNGTINYQLPSGTATIYGYINFTLDTLNHNFTLSLYNPPVQYLNSENSKIIDLVIVCIVVALMALLVKAPNRDDFFIDIPTMSEQKRMPIKLTPQQITDVFDRQNSYFSWKFMPLSKSELKAAISNNIKSGGASVNLTIENIEVLLDQLVGNGTLVMADNLYAPKYWLEKSGYDIEYLATFKKLRIYFVANSYIFTEIGASNMADIVATRMDERKFINIYSKTSKFVKLPVFRDSRVYLAFLNSYAMEEFESKLYSVMDEETMKMKMFIDAGQVRLVNVDEPSETLA